MTAGTLRQMVHSKAPPLQNGDRLTRAEFERRYEATPDLKKAELIDGIVHIANEGIYSRLNPRIPPLENGDHMSRAEFERRWDNMPELKKAELLNGVVYMPPPVSTGYHGLQDSDLSIWLGTYRVQTTGLDTSINSTLRLPGDNDPQADETLFILREYGGSAWLDEKGYLHGVPELAAEVAASSVSYDRHEKMKVYQAAGISEYLIHRVYDRAMDWFVLRDGTYQPLPPELDGITRSLTFPGLWLDPNALVRRDMKQVLAILNKGLASPAHEAFVERLQQAYIARTPSPQSP
jgi:hypothetical protein